MENDFSEHKNKKRRKAEQSDAVKVKNKGLILTFRILLAVVLVFGFALAGGVVGAYFGIIKNVDKIDDSFAITPNIFTTIFYDAKTGEEIDRLEAAENREYVTIDKVPKHLQNALVAIEDERFYAHDGIDIRGMFRALYVNLTDPDRNEGASTITQQVIKNSRGIISNTLETKLQEQYLAVNYEKDLIEKLGSKEAAKKHILEVYLNIIGLHYNINGVQTAANYYFDKDVSELTLSESTVIAGITNSPGRYNPIVNPDNNNARRKKILDKMLELEMITQREYDEALKDDVYTRISQNERVTEERTSFHSYFVDYTSQQILKDLQDKYTVSTQEASNWLYNKGLQIFVTQDQDMQKIMDEAYLDNTLFPEKIFEIDLHYDFSTKNTITGKEQRFEGIETLSTEEEVEEFINTIKNENVGSNDVVTRESFMPVLQPQSAMVIIDQYTGQVKALTGGRGPKLANKTLNRATASVRQPGSVFKILASYAPALDLGLITPATVYDDAPVTFEQYDNYTPKNWNSRFLGNTTVRDGIINSMNILAVKNIMNTGIEPSYNYLENFGLSTLVASGSKNDKGPAALALGGITNGVTQLEITAAFAAIANQGEYIKPTFYTQVLDHDGKPILENSPEPRQVLKKQTAYLLTDMMKDVITRGTGGRARFKEVKMPVAGKTGTTTDDKDLMFVGYTPYYTAGIYLGFDQPKPIKANDSPHLTVWRTIMEKIHAGLKTKDFEKPEGITSASVCKKSGLLAVSGLCDSDPRGSMVKSELFVAGTQPTESCDVHVSTSIDTSTNMIANEFCPPELLATSVGMVKPGVIDDVTEDRPYIVTYDGSGEVCNAHGPFSTPEEPGSLDDIIIDDMFYVDENGQLQIRTPEPNQTPSSAQTEPPALPGVNGTAMPTYSPPTMPPTPTPTPIVVPEYTPRATSAPNAPTMPPATVAPSVVEPVISDPS